MRTVRTFCLALAWAVGVASGGCVAAHDPGVTRREITALLEVQSQAWNRGDIETFMEPYWHSPDLTFCSGGKVTRGWQATLERYRNRYPTTERMGRLTFTELEVQNVAPHVAMVLGRWRLEREGPIAGNFSLVMRREDGRWIILHDHTSVDETP